MKVSYSNSVASHHKTWHSQLPSNIVIEQRLELNSFIINGLPQISSKSYILCSLYGFESLSKNAIHE